MGKRSSPQLSILSSPFPSTREPDICMVIQKSLSIFPEVAIESAVAQDLRDGFKCHKDRLLPDQTGGLTKIISDHRYFSI
jgi:hypothetical protein